MKSIDRLKEIDKEFSKPSTLLSSTDARWLISRVKRLTEALEFYEDEANYGAGDFVWKKCSVMKDFGSIAQQALEEE